MVLGIQASALIGAPFTWITLSLIAFICCPIGSYVSSLIAIPALRPFYHEFFDENDTALKNVT